ncbi:kinase-like domain-containing protein [Whalleya microplaca]|nr:kinase-like domain-containing protein [Whalleya microplaca]
MEANVTSTRSGAPTISRRSIMIGNPEEDLANVSRAIATELRKLQTMVTTQSPCAIRTTQKSQLTKTQPENPLSPRNLDDVPEENKRIQDSLDLRSIKGVRQVRLLARGGYNSIYVVEMDTPIKIPELSTTDTDSSIVAQEGAPARKDDPTIVAQEDAPARKDDPTIVAQEDAPARKDDPTNEVASKKEFCPKKFLSRKAKLSLKTLRSLKRKLSLKLLSSKKSSEQTTKEDTPGSGDTPAHVGIVSDGDTKPVIGSVMIDQFILRLPDSDALLPNQLTNEVAFRRFVAAKLPHIPVPKVYHYEATGQIETCFMVEEFIHAHPLSHQWMSLSPLQKEGFAQQLAIIIVDLAEIEFDMIGGLDPVGLSSAPTVEGHKIFKGRDKFHREECYPIGPYKTTKEYILACYEKEIYFYSHTNQDFSHSSLFNKMSIESFVKVLRKKREILETTDIPEEPFVLIHGDLHGRNILARDGQILAILDWEFAGSYPLSETLDMGCVQVTEYENDEEYDESTKWERKIETLIRQEVTYRRWDQKKIDMLIKWGKRGDNYKNVELEYARIEMFPSHFLSSVLKDEKPAKEEPVKDPDAEASQNAP